MTSPTTEPSTDSTEPASTPASSAPTASAGRGRGRTVVDDRVRRKLIEHAVLTVPGTSKQRGLTARPLPSVKYVDQAGSELAVQVAAEWPVDSAALITSVQTSVRDELTRSLGENPPSIDVHIARINDDRDDSEAAFAFRGAAGDLTPEAESETPSLIDSKRFAPRRAPGSVVVGVLVLLALLALGVIAVRDTVISFGWAQGSRWLDAVPRIADDVRWEWWAWPAAVAAVIVGLILLIGAVKPRKRSHKPVTDTLWLHRRFQPTTPPAPTTAPAPATPGTTSPSTTERPSTTESEDA